MEIKKELDEKIIKIIVKMAQKGMIRSSADTPAESVTFDYLSKDYDGKILSQLILLKTLLRGIRK